MWQTTVVAWHKANPVSQRLAAIPGIGPLIATAIAATVADPAAFRSAREFAAWIGLTPRQKSTGGKQRLGRISRQGDQYTLSKETLVREMAGIGFAVTGYERDDGRMDLREVGRGGAAILHAKRGALMDIARICGWIVEKREDITPLEQRLRAMTPEQREADAEDLYRSAMQRLLEDRSATGEDESEGRSTFEDVGRD